MSDATVEEVIAEAGDAAYHTVLEMWQKVLSSADATSVQRITPQWASRIITTYPEMTYKDMPAFRYAYFSRVLDMLHILDAVIETDDECLKQTTPEEDVAHNTGNYLTVMLDWQKQILQWELDWDCTSKDAPILLAAASEIHKMFFAEEGFTALVDRINLEFTDDHRQMFADELQRMRDEADSE